MAAFRTAVDIANRALQHCGATRMNPLKGFGDTTSRGASEIGFNYDKLRRAELQRNNWKFAIRRAALRPIETNTINSTDTLLLAPALWVSTTTYFVGSIVVDQNGTIWQSNTPNNIGNQPLITSAWDEYFGPMSVSAWDTTGSTFYFAGELVYTTTGAGVDRVFVSLIEGNADNPSAASVWNSTATYYQNQIATFFPNWSSATTYAFGAGVTFNGIPFISIIAGNTDNPPAGSVEWMQLPLTSTGGVQEPDWNVATFYPVNSIVNFGGVLFIASAQSTGLVPPNNPGSWMAVSGGVAYMSLFDLNINQEPDLAPPLWSATVTFSIGAKVGGSDGQIYISLANFNVGVDPTTNGGAVWQPTGILNPWTTVFVSGTGSRNWRQIGGPEFPMGVTVAPLNIIYPIGAGPSSQATTRNTFVLPAGFLRKAPQDPKAGSQSWLGAPSGLIYNDWNIEGKYLTSRMSDAILLRFTADTVDVTSFDDMFCEGLAARIGLEIDATLTQSKNLQTIASAYAKFMGEARTVNSIEIGPEEPPVDDYIFCRL
jgi:hypothetical protein